MSGTVSALDGAATISPELHSTMAQQEEFPVNKEIDYIHPGYGPHKNGYSDQQVKIKGKKSKKYK